MQITLEKQREYKRKFHQKQRELGLCLDCINPAAEGKKRCQPHLDERRRQDIDKRLKSRSSGICHKCYKSPQLPHNPQCELCYYKRVARRHLGTSRLWFQLKEKFERQNGKCALSGLPLTLGLNTDLDHITPKIRGGDNSLENLQWVLSIVNTIKSGTPEPELFLFIKAIYDTMKSKYD